jgi:hypothetical protein
MSSVVATVGVGAAIVVGALVSVRSLISKAMVRNGGIKYVPSDLRNVTMLGLNNIIAPCLLLLVFSVIKDIGSLLIGVPFLMRSKDLIEDVKGKTAEDTKTLNDGIAKLVTARQTFFRLQAFMVIAILLSLLSIGVGLKKTTPDLKNMDWSHVASELMMKSNFR